MSEELRARVKRFLEEVSRDWGVRPPDFIIRGIPEFLNANGYYDNVIKTIVVDPKSVTLRVVIHEFAHHLQYEYGLIDDKVVREAWSKPHCARDFERWAKFFEKSFDRFYERLWREIVGV